MATVHFTLNLKQHVDCPVATAPGQTVAQVLGAVFTTNPKARGYILDEHGALRKHMVVFVDGRAVLDRVTLSDAVSQTSEIYVMQALSGG
jgi:sulfur carrier protein ThiS